MRLFIAIDLDEDARRRIAAEQSRVVKAVGGGEGMALVRPHQLHLTLVFLGEVEEARVPALAAAVGAGVPLARYSIAFGGLGVFPAAGRPRVLWLGVQAGVRDTIELQRRLAARVREAGVGLDAPAFHPHLTLARWRRSRESDRRRVRDADRGREVARVQVESAVLYRSRLSSEGPAYTAVARAKLD